MSWKQFVDWIEKSVVSPVKEWSLDPIGANRSLKALARSLAKGSKEGSGIQGGILMNDKMSDAIDKFTKTSETMFMYSFPDLKEKGGLLNALSGFTGTITSQVGIATAVVGSGLIITNHVADGIKQSITIDKIDKKYKENLHLTFDKIDEAREKVKLDVKEVLGETDRIFERRIDQISDTLKETISGICEIAENYSPELYMTKLVDPTINKLNNLEKEIFSDFDQRIEFIFNNAEKFRDQLDGMITGTLEEVRYEYRKLGNLYGVRSEIEIYRKMELESLKKLNDDEISISGIIDVYGQLELNAIRLAAVARKAPSMRKQALRDWVKYRLLADFWDRASYKPV